MFLQDFENLDDIKQSDNINLREDGSERRLASERKHLMPPMPMALVPLNEQEKRDVPLLNKRGEAVGKMDDFKINTAVLHWSGTLLLDRADAHLADAAGIDEDYGRDCSTVAHP